MEKSITQPIMNRAMLELNEKEFYVLKIYQWKNLLDADMMPIRWNEPNKEGTDIKCIQIETPEQKQQSLSDFRAYLEEINEKYNLDFRFMINDWWGLGIRIYASIVQR